MGLREDHDFDALVNDAEALVIDALEAAIAGQARQQHILETEFRSLAPGGHITHAQTLSDFALL